MKNTLVLLMAGAAIFLSSGCAVKKQYQATGGSKADGVVRLSYEVADMQKPIVSEEQGLKEAASRCKRWGYTSAEPFGGTIRRCSMGGGFGGCSLWLVSKDYQCTK